MDKVFERLFSKKANDTSNGYYFYNVKDEAIKYEASVNQEEHFKDAWSCKNPLEVVMISSDLKQIINKIAVENKPVLEISCGEYMGLAPFILKYNPEFQYLAKDITIL